MTKPRSRSKASDALRDLLTSYPGGIKRLAEAADISRQSAYNLLQGASKAPPMATIRAVAAAFRKAGPLGQKFTIAQLVSAWRAARAG